MTARSVVVLNEEAVLLKFRTAAAMLGVGPDTLRRLIADGHLRPITIPGTTCRRIPRRQLEALAAGGVPETTEAAS